MNLRVVDSLDGDLPEQLHRLYLGEWWTHRRDAEAVRRMLEGSDVVIGLVDEDGRLAGFARVVTDFVYKALVLDVIVEASHRGTGLGARLMDEVVGHPRLRDVVHFELYCRPELVPFYERWGFTDRLGEMRFMRRGPSPTPPKRSSRSDRARELAGLAEEIASCRRCPRLVAWREEVATTKVARFADQEYWGRPVPGFGDPDARVLLVGLAPAAHGGNRTGRIFTGDRSGDFLFASLHRTGFANQPTSVHRDDGLRLLGMYVAATVRCAPPANRPTPRERDNCLPFLLRELELLADVRAVVALGAFAWNGALRALAAHGHPGRPRPAFGHLAEATVGPYVLLGSFHPSQQNTFTGKLTPEMLDAVFVRARRLAATHGG